jgi:endo-1,4-beta-xylanase
MTRLPSMPRRRLLATAGACALSGCAAPAAQPALPAREAPPLARSFAPFFPVGIATTPGQVLMGDTAFLAKHFNILVAENAMKPASLAKAGEGRYDFMQADHIVDFAAKHGMQMRGHTLVWHQQMPHWFFSDGTGGEVGREVLIARMRRYITDVVGHFKGRVQAWDVVNEAFEVNGKPGEADADGWRLSPWLRIIGRDYLELAFRFAHEADPQARLFYNDYETQHPAKRRLVTALVRDFRARGVPIHGIGHQAHCSIVHPRAADLEAAIVEVAQLGLTNHITELDVSLNRDIRESEVSEVTPRLLAEQARQYTELFEMFIRQRDKVSAVLMWGLHDDVSWLRYWPMPRVDAPLLFDGELQPKPAFWALVDLAARRAAASSGQANGKSAVK